MTRLKKLIVKQSIYNSVRSDTESRKMFFDYYRLPGPWYNVKYAFYYCFFTVIKIIFRVFDVHTKHGGPRDNDGPHGLDDVIGYDATWIGGTTADGKWIMLGLDRRKDRKTSVGYAYLKIPGVGTLATPTYPDSVENALGKSENDFSLDEFSLKMDRPLRQWTINFTGKMTFVDNPSVSARVKIAAQWTSKQDAWSLNRDFSAESFADSFALLPWSKFAEILSDRAENDVVHWEQFGRLSADVEVDEKSVEVRDAMTLRDRTFGKFRDFTTIHRYFFLTMFLKNGRSLMLAVVCHKITFSRLFYGFISNDDGTNSNVDWSDLHIHHFGENGRAVDELCFLIKINDVVHTVQLVCDCQRWYRLEKDVVRCEQTGKCLLDEQPGRCMVQSQYSETSLKAKTFCKPLSFLDN